MMGRCGGRLGRWLRVGRLLLAGLSLALMGVLFSSVGDGLALLAKGQFGPALMAVGARFALSGLAVVGVTLLLTLFLGRFFCSVMCPLGILQDVLGGLFFFRRNGVRARWVGLRKGLGVAVWAVALVGGWTLGLRFLEPFTLFGAICSGAWVPLLLLALATFWRRRVFCNSLCPVGALLACESAMAPLGLRFTAHCVKCGKCVKVCPAGCLDPATGRVDNGRCVRCMACVDACSLGGLAYGRNAGFGVPGRRAFLRAGAALAGGGALAVAARQAAPHYADLSASLGVTHIGIYPPGAGSRQRFLTKCTDCRLCVTHCTGQVLQPAGRFGAVHLTFDRGMCEYECRKCVEVCPTGALMPMDLATKKRTRLGLARVDYTLCVAACEGFACGACAEHCPTGALRMKENAAGVLTPALDTRLCIGCGSCEHPCPVRPVKAIRVEPVDGVQVLAADPEEVFAVPAPEAIEDSDTWLI